MRSRETSVTTKGKGRRRLAALVCGIAAVAILVPVSQASAALVVQDFDHGASADGLAQSLAGEGVTISNVSFTGAGRAAGTFGGGEGIIGFDSGVILDSGKVQTVASDPPCSRGVEGPNNCHELGGPDGGSNSTSFGNPGDADLTALSGFGTFDAAILEFDFVPASSSVNFSFVFSSDEYSDFSNTSFNDVFAFFVNGANCATVPGTGEPISINTINNGNDVGGDPTPHNPELFRDNVNPSPTIDTQMDGLTTVLPCSATVNANQTNHMKLAIADASDSILDSAVFLQAGSLVSPAPPVAAEGLNFDITGRKKQKPVGPQVKPANHRAKNQNRKLLSVKVSCDKACTVSLGGNAKSPGEKVKFKSQTVSLQAGETKRVRLSATSKKALAELKAALRAGAKGKGKVNGTATGPAGQQATDSFTVKLRGK
jgi:hypothetical protein